MKTERETNLFMLVFLVYEFASSLLVDAGTKAAGITGLLPRVAVLQVATFLVPCVVLLAMRRVPWREIFPLRWIGWKNVLFILLLMLCAQPVMMFLSGLSAMLFGNQVSETVTDMMQTGGLGATVLVVGFLPAVMEEAVFRGVILSGYKNAGLWTAALVNGIFFGIMHLNPQQFLYAFCMGMLFALMVRHTRSLLASVLAHSAVNVTQTMLAFGAGQAAAAAEVQTAELTALEAFPPEMALEMQATLDWITANAAIIAVVVMLVISLFAAPVFVLVYRAFARYNEARNERHSEAGNMQMEFNLSTPESPAVIPEAKPFNWSFWCVVVIYVLYYAATLFVLYFAQS